MHQQLLNLKFQTAPDDMQWRPSHWYQEGDIAMRAGRPDLQVHSDNASRQIVLLRIVQFERGRDMRVQLHSRTH